MSRVYFNSIYITVQRGAFFWLVSLIQIGPVTLMIKILLHIIFSSLVPDISLGIVRNNRPWLFIQ
jgi:hypothetical protein